MPKDTADIVGTTGISFVASISSGTISRAQLEVVNQPVIKLAVDATGRNVTVPNLPAGDSSIGLALDWKPGEPNAVIGVASGPAQVAEYPTTLYDNDPTGEIILFGEDAA